MKDFWEKGNFGIPQVYNLINVTGVLTRFFFYYKKDLSTFVQPSCDHYWLFIELVIYDLDPFTMLVSFHVPN